MARLFTSVHHFVRVLRQQKLPAFFLLVLTASGCGPGSGGEPGASPGGPPGGAGGNGRGGMPVEIVTLESKPVERASEFVATVKSRSSTTIQPQVEGFLTRILVTSGQRVTPGTQLFEVDSTTQQALVASLESQRAAREADVTYARQQAERVKRLLDVGAASQQEHEQAVAQAATTAAQLAVLDEQIRQQQAELAYYRIVAPTAGIVGDVPVRVGDRVVRSTVLTTIEDNTGLEVYIQVPVQQAPELRVGLPVEILNGADEPIARASIAFVAASVDDATQTVLAKALLTPRAGLFRSDQFVRVRLVWGMEAALTIPVVAVQRIAGQLFVFVAEPGEGGMLVARQRAVHVGAVVGSDYLVLDGVSEGERLIVAGIQKIGDGAPVQAGLPGRGGPGGAPPGGAPGSGREGRGGQ